MTGCWRRDNWLLEERHDWLLEERHDWLLEERHGWLCLVVGETWLVRGETWLLEERHCWDYHVFKSVLCLQ